MIFNWRLIITICLSLFSCFSYSAKLAIVIDDFGYRQNTEEQILQMPLEITIAILPNSPLRKEMMAKAQKQGREILIHMPMAPVSKQPLEKDTLFPSMSEEEITRIIEQAIANVPAAKGMNNHMGSAMTSDLDAMKRVMRVLEKHGFYFLDSMTTSRSQVNKAAEGTNIKILKRRIFLDDDKSEAAVLREFNNAVRAAKRDGFAIAIGHPHPSTVKVLKQMLPQLPADVELVTLSSLLNEQQTQKPQKPSSGVSEPLPMPEIIDIPLEEPEEPENVSASQLQKDLTPCPVEIPEDLNVPSQLSILMEAVEDSLSKLEADNEDEDKDNAYLYIS